MKILFCGPGYGAGNIGDDAILSGILRSVRSYLPKRTQYGAIVFPDYTKERAETDIVFRYEEEVRDAFDWATHIVLGGATLIGDWGIPRCSKIIELAHTLKKPICMLGVGVTDKPMEDHLVLLREFFGSLDLITVRSEKDKEIAISYGLSSERLKVTADNAFAIDCKDVFYSSKNFFGINLVNEGLSEKYPYELNMRRYLTENSRALDLLFICGETRKDTSFDYVMLLNLYKQFGGKFICEYFSYLELLKILASCNVVLTMRMHMVIFCSLIGVPCIPLIGERKTSLMAESLGFSQVLSLDESFIDFTSLISGVLKNPEKALADVNKVEDMKKRALNGNGLLLQEWISKSLEA